MLVFRPSEEARRFGRWLYIIGAVTIGFHSYGLTFETNERFPVRFPEGFPLTAVSTLVLLFLLISVLVRLVDEVASFFYEQAVEKHEEARQPPITVDDVARFAPDTEHRARARVIGGAPAISAIALCLILCLDIVVPVAFASYVTFACSGSVMELLGGHFGQSSQQGIPPRIR